QDDGARDTPQAGRGNSDAEVAAGRLAGGRGGEVRHVVARQRAFGRRDAGLHFGLLARRQVLDALGLEFDCPARWAAARQRDVVGGGAAVVAHYHRDRRQLAGLGLATHQAVPAGQAQARLADDFQLQLAGGLDAVRAGDDLHRIAAGLGVAGRADGQLDVLGFAGLDRQRADLLAAIAFGEAGVEVLRGLGGEADGQVLAAVVLDRQRVVEGRLRAAADGRQFRIQ